jgi:hypothetical protein
MSLKIPVSEFPGGLNGESELALGLGHGTSYRVIYFMMFTLALGWLLETCLWAGEILPGGRRSRRLDD